VTVNNPAPGGGTSSSSGSLTVTDYAVSSPSGAQTVAAGAAATFTITVAASGGAFGNPVTLSNSTLPAASTGMFSANPVTPGSTSATSNFTVTTTARSKSAVPPAGGPSNRPIPGPPGLVWLTVALLGFMSAVLARRGLRTRRYAAYLPLAVLFLSVAGILGCANAKVAGTPAGTSTITITATSGGVAKTLTFKLTVQ